jgi:hypothetical protein
MTTAAAAVYCGFRSASALRKAKLEGRVRPAGRRGGRGTWMWAREELDRFLRGNRVLPFPRNVQVRLRQTEMHMKRLKEWKFVRNSWIRPRPVLPGGWQRKEGGHAVRGRARCSRTGKQRHIWKVLPEATAEGALPG